MDRIAFPFYTDIHIDSKVRSRVDNYFESIVGKLGQIGRLIKAQNCIAALCGGDIYNRKGLSVPRYLDNKLIKIFKDWRVPNYSIAGNHDLLYDSYDHLLETPYGILVEAGAITDIFLEKNVIQLCEGNLKVEIRAVPWNRKITVGDLYFERLEDSDYQVVVVHTFASPSGGEFFGEYVIPYRELLNHPADVFAFGHSHENLGVKEYDGKWFVNQGAVGRFRIFPNLENFIPQISMMEFFKDRINIIPIALDYKQPSECFNMEEMEMEKEEQRDIDAFIIALAKETMQAKTAEDYLEELKDIPYEVRQRVLNYLGEEN